jgi:DNA replication protein DnaC
MNKIDSIFSSSVEALRDCGFDPYPKCLRLQVVEAKEMLDAGLRYYLGDSAKWLPCYDEVAAWLADNKGRGLLCLGPCGLGKTLIVQNILPVIIHRHTQRIVSTYSAQEMNDNIKDVIKHKLIVIDDIGTEPATKFDYGERSTPFLKLCDAAEKRGILLMMTANLRTTHGTDRQGNTIPSIEDRYGDLVLSRLRSVVKIVQFKGKDMRGTSQPNGMSGK